MYARDTRIMDVANITVDPYSVLSSIFLESHGPWLIACTEQEHTVARDDQIRSECALYRTIKFVGGESSRHARACVLCIIETTTLYFLGRTLIHVYSHCMVHVLLYWLGLVR